MDLKEKEIPISFRQQELNTFSSKLQFQFKYEIL